jgi:hypothetical protein
MSYSNYIKEITNLIDAGTCMDRTDGWITENVLNYECNEKKWRGTKILLCGYMTYSRRNFPEFQMGLRFGVPSDQLSAQPHIRSNSEKKNFTQH